MERKGPRAKVPGSELARVLLADSLQGANGPGSYTCFAVICGRLQSFLYLFAVVCGGLRSSAVVCGRLRSSGRPPVDARREPDVKFNYVRNPKSCPNPITET